VAGEYIVGISDGARPPPELQLGPLPPHPTRGCCLAARSLALTGTFTCGAAPADRVAPTSYVSGVVAAAIGTTADLSADRRGRLCEVRSARENE
jgi:hypothetical protein